MFLFSFDIKTAYFFFTSPGHSNNKTYLNNDSFVYVHFFILLQWGEVSTVALEQVLAHFQKVELSPICNICMHIVHLLVIFLQNN